VSIEQGIVVKNYTIVTEFAKKYSYLVTKSKRYWVLFVTNTYEIRQIKYNIGKKEKCHIKIELALLN